jgi:hydrogenase nickel incorporation protein HypA/HybF
MALVSRERRSFLAESGNPGTPDFCLQVGRVSGLSWQRHASRSEPERAGTGQASMHELAIAQSVLDTIVARIGDRQVRQVRLEIGRLSGVSADSLRFCFELAAVGTVLDGALLDIVEPPGKARCLTCLDEFVLHDHILLCACGSSDVRLTAGDELKILSVEVSR